MEVFSYWMGIVGYCLILPFNYYIHTVHNRIHCKLFMNYIVLESFGLKRIK